MSTITPALRQEITSQLEHLNLCLRTKNEPALLDQLAELQAEQTQIRNDYILNRRAKPCYIEAARCLFGKLPLEKLLAQVGVLLRPRDLFSAASRLTGDEHLPLVMELIDRTEFPAIDSTDRIGKLLIASPGTMVTEWLQGKIEAQIESEARAGTVLSRHEQSQREFRYVRWNPSDSGLSRMVALLASRTDPLARQLSEQYLLSLPWGSDRLASRRLVETLQQEQAPEREQMFRRALEIHTKPSQLRIWLWDAVSDYDTPSGVEGVWHDLAGCDDEAVQVAYLGWLKWGYQQCLSYDIWIDGPRQARAILALPVQHWSRFSRALLGEIVTEYIPEIPAEMVCPARDRRAFKLVRAFNTWRIEHMSAPLTLGVLAGLALLYTAVLGWLAGPLPPDLADLPYWAILLPVGIGAGTMHTHFSFRETFADQYRSGLFYFGSMLFFATGVAGLHAWANWVS